MTPSRVPPQAYTRETLLQAFDWFNKQPPLIRQKAKTVDTLVSLYLTHMRKEESFLFQSHSDEKKWKWAKPGNTDLSENQEGESPVSSSHVKQKITKKTFFHSETLEEKSSPTSPTLPSSRSFPRFSSSSFQENSDSVKENPPLQYPYETLLSKLIDDKSLRLIQDTQLRLNLSSEKEALRLLLSLGYEKLQLLFS